MGNILAAPASPGTTWFVNRLSAHSDGDLRFEVLNFAVFFEHDGIVTSHLGGCRFVILHCTS
jgi:hypothetical protein